MDLPDKKATGMLGEKIACLFLQERGFSILCRNYRTKPGEVDIITKKGGLTVFVEVKTRSGISFGSPEESISRAKVDRIKKAAEIFLMDKDPLGKSPVRFDVVSIRLDRHHLESMLQGDAVIMELAENYKNFSTVEHMEDAF